MVVNLAGAPTAGNPHSQRWADELLRSRVVTTRVLAEAIAAAGGGPSFLAGNGISYYGDHGDEVVTETSDSRGDALLTRVTREWQEATAPAVDAGARVCVLRTSPVLDRASAPLKQLVPLFKLGLGARLGDGRQYFPMISLRDWVGRGGVPRREHRPSRARSTCAAPRRRPTPSSPPRSPGRCTGRRCCAPRRSCSGPAPGGWPPSCSGRSARGRRCCSTPASSSPTTTSRPWSADRACSAAQ